MKKKIILALIIVVSISFGILIGSGLNKEEASFEDDTSKPKQMVNENTLSMMLEAEVGSGKYEMTTASSWPTDGYLFNATLSKCANGGELGWDDTNKVVTMTGNMSDKCFIYFDKLPGSIDVNFVGSTSTTLKINVISEDGTPATGFDTYYYSTDGGTTYVSSSSNTYSVDYTSGTISSLSVYASVKSINSPNTYTKKVFNGGTIVLASDLSYSDEVCGYYGKLETEINYYYVYNNVGKLDNMAGYLFNNSTMNINGSRSISGSGSNDYYIRMVGTSTLKNGNFTKWNNLNIISDGGSLTLDNISISTSNLYFSLTDTTLNLASPMFKNVNGTFAFNLNGTVSLVNNGINITGDTVLIKVTGNSNVLSGTISSFGDLSSDGVTFLKALIENTSFSVTTLSFDFNGFTFTLDEAQTYINSLS